MQRFTRGTLIAAFVAFGASTVVYADFQNIAPGTGLQGALEVDTGANGICDTAAGAGDIQAIPQGTAPKFQPEIKCGPNKVADTTAAGDDTQLVPVGSPCQNPNTIVIDTGSNGVADSTAAGDDVQLIPVGTIPPNTPCVLTGATGVANTHATGDDVQILPFGTVQANTAVIRCGPNKIADTTANNVGSGGDDVQRVAVGSPCGSQNTIVVDSGANGVSTTRAEGSDLVVKALSPVSVTIAKGKGTASKTVRVSVANVEFGSAAPASRTYTLSVTDGSCPSGTVSQVDANASTTTLESQASVAKGKKITGRFVATFHLEDITSVARTIPFRCSVNVEADVVDPALNGAADDASNPTNNTTPVDFEVVDRNDLP